MPIGTNPLAIEGGSPVPVTPQRSTGRQRVSTPGDAISTRVGSYHTPQRTQVNPRSTPVRPGVLSPPREFARAVYGETAMEIEPAHNISSSKNNMVRYGSYIQRSGPTRNPDSIWAHLKVYNDPFSGATQIPKIPDGKCVSSTGLSNNASYEHTIDATTTTIVLFPGLESNAYIYSSTTATPNNYKVMTLSNKQVMQMEGSGGEVLASQNDATQLHRWRRVSNGIHIGLTNNAENNDGWFEACRIGTTTDAAEWLLARVGTAATGEYALFPETAKDITSEEMQRLPSYVVGDLRDIKHVIFPLRPEGNEHDLTSIRDFYRTTAMVDASQGAVATKAGLSQTAATAYTELQRFPSDDISNNDFVKSNVDFGWDTVIIRIYGRADATNNPSKLRITIAQNDELVYHERSIMSKFMTKSPMMQGFTVNNGSPNATQPVNKDPHARGPRRQRRLQPRRRMAAPRRMLRRAPVRRAPVRRTLRRAAPRRRRYRARR